MQCHIFYKERDQSILQQKILYKNRNMDTIAPIFCKLITVIFKFRSQIPSSFSSIWLNHDFCFSFSFDRTLFFTLKSVVLIILFKKIKSIIILPDLRFLNRNWCKTLRKIFWINKSFVSKCFTFWKMEK